MKRQGRIMRPIYAILPGMTFMLGLVVGRALRNASLWNLGVVLVWAIYLAYYIHLIRQANKLDMRDLEEIRREAQELMAEARRIVYAGPAIPHPPGEHESKTSEPGRKE